MTSRPRSSRPCVYASPVKAASSREAYKAALCACSDPPCVNSTAPAAVSTRLTRALQGPALHVYRPDSPTPQTHFGGYGVYRPDSSKPSIALLWVGKLTVGVCIDLPSLRAPAPQAVCASLRPSPAPAGVVVGKNVAALEANGG